MKIVAKTRIGDQNFPETIRKALVEGFPEEMIGMCGVFLIKKGAAYMHIPTKFPDKPFSHKDEVNLSVQRCSNVTF